MFTLEVFDQAVDVSEDVRNSSGRRPARYNPDALP
jgi:hypothetical protein